MTRRIAFCLFTLATLTLAAAEWPGWRGANRDGKSPDKGLLQQWPEGGPTLLWQQTGFGDGFSTVAVTNDAIYATGHVDEKLVLFSLDLDGKQRWRVDVDDAFKNSHKGARSTPVVDDGRVFVLGGKGRLAAYAVADGALLWQQELTKLGGRVPGWGFSESPLVYKDLLIATPGGKKPFVAFNKENGEIVWQSEGFELAAHYSSPILVTFRDIDMIVNGTGSGLYGISVKDGSLLWHNDFAAKNTANCPDPVHEDGRIFWSVGYNKGAVAVELVPEGDSVGVKELYRTGNMVNHHGNFVVLDGYVYGHHNNNWTCLDIKTGEVKWQERGVGKGAICYADGMLYTFSERGGAMALVSATPEGYQEHGRFSVAGTGPSWAHPVVINGRLYLRYADNLYCYDVKK